MRGRVIVENNTGHAIHVGGCGTLFQVALASKTYRPAVAWLGCLQRDQGMLAQWAHAAATSG